MGGRLGVRVGEGGGRGGSRRRENGTCMGTVHLLGRGGGGDAITWHSFPLHGMGLWEGNTPLTVCDGLAPLARCCCLMTARPFVLIISRLVCSVCLGNLLIYAFWVIGL